MDIIKINDRLLDATKFVRAGARLADVGTDHAYLPIYLAQTGKISTAIATDINAGPLESARKNIAAYGYSDRIAVLLCDGLSEVSAEDVDDIAILGMGGELIARIIEYAPWLRSRGKRLILQPMTHPERLREALLKSGFAIIDESISEDRGRVYQTICAVWDGEKRTHTPLELMFGKILLEHGNELTIRQLEMTRVQIERRLPKMPENSPETIADAELLREINTYLEEHRNDRK